MGCLHLITFRLLSILELSKIKLFVFQIVSRLLEKTVRKRERSRCDSPVRQFIVSRTQRYSPVWRFKKTLIHVLPLANRWLCKNSHVYFRPRREAEINQTHSTVGDNEHVMGVSQHFVCFSFFRLTFFAPNKNNANCLFVNRSLFFLLEATDQTGFRRSKHFGCIFCFCVKDFLLWFSRFKRFRGIDHDVAGVIEWLSSVENDKKKLTSRSIHIVASIGSLLPVGCGAVFAFQFERKE